MVELWWSIYATEAAAAAAVYAAFAALFIYRDMGPFKEEPWVRDTDSLESVIGFKSTVIQ